MSNATVDVIAPRTFILPTEENVIPENAISGQLIISGSSVCYIAPGLTGWQELSGQALV